jgi:hypothetical protein
MDVDDTAALSREEHEALDGNRGRGVSIVQTWPGITVLNEATTILGYPQRVVRVVTFLDTAGR